MKIDKDLLQQAMEEVMEEDLSRIDNSLEEENLNKHIENAKNRMNWEDLYRESQKSDKHKLTRWKKAAAIFLIFLIASTSTAYAIEKVWKEGVIWQVKQGKNEDSFLFDEDHQSNETDKLDSTQKENVNKEAPDEIEIYYEPAYIPDGYKKLEEESTGIENIVIDMLYVKKEKDNIKNSITFSQSVLEASVTIDSEDMARKTVDIDSWKGQLNYKKNKKALIWATDEYIFTVHSYGNASEEELIKIARSLKPVKKN